MGAPVEKNASGALTDKRSIALGAGFPIEICSCDYPEAVTGEVWADVGVNLSVELMAICSYEF